VDPIVWLEEKFPKQAERSVPPHIGVGQEPQGVVSANNSAFCCAVRLQVQYTDWMTGLDDTALILE
jgi:hypothetical protein